MNDDEFDKLLSGLNDPEPERPAQPKKATPAASVPPKPTPTPTPTPTPKQAAPKQAAPKQAAPKQAAPKQKAQKSPHPALPWIVVSVVALLLIGGGITFAVMSQGDSDAAAPVASEEPLASEEPSPEPAPETPAPVASTLPTACRDLFSPAYYDELASTGAALSEGNTGPREHPLGPEVPAVVESTVAEAPHLECSWGFEENFNVGINTVLAEVTDEQAAQVTAALESAGFRASNELGSVRYIKENPGMEGFGPSGYSIIARDGVLFATEWIDWPAAGYTADIVNTVLGPAE